MANAYNNKVVLSNGTTLIDLSTDTVTDASHIMSGKVGHLADGSVVTGTGASESQVVSIEDVPNTTGTTAVITGVAAPEGSVTITTNGTHDVTAYEEAIVNVPSQTPTIQPLSVTSNGTYTAPSGVDGYSPVTVNVSGGGGSVDSDADVIFIDYDGTVLHSYSASEFANLTAMPANPTHSGLVAQGWNWTLADAKAQLAAYPKAGLTIGQMYATASGKTEIDINVDNPDFLSPYLGIAVNGTATIDWGDNSTADTVTGASYTVLTYTPHVYATTGRYTITIDGPMAFYCNSNGFGSLLTDKTSLSNRRTYSQYIEAIRCGMAARINDNAFANCCSLQSITIPDSVTSIGTYAFIYCYALQSVTIPDGVTSIGTYAFNSCYALQSVTIPDGVTSIDANAFANCYALQSVMIPDGVTNIGNYAFQNCCSLRSITIPDGVTNIGNYALQNCYALQSITIPDSVTSIGAYAFSGCYTLQSGTIPDGVTNIGNYTFANCYALQSVTIPDGVTSIGTYVFNNCRSLQSITIPDGVTNIENYTFANCSLQSITIPDGVTSIGNSAFSGCSTLQSVTIPDSVTSIGTQAFGYCYSVMKYHLLPTTPPTLSGTNAFTGIVAGTIIYVPQGSLEAYQTATNWSTYASYMVEEE